MQHAGSATYLPRDRPATYRAAARTSLLSAAAVIGGASRCTIVQPHLGVDVARAELVQAEALVAVDPGTQSRIARNAGRSLRHGKRRVT